MELIWTNQSILDLKEFRNYTKMSNPNVYISSLIKSVDLLVEQPHLGKIYSYIKGVIVRQLIHEQHRVFYYIKDNKTFIIAVIHHRQNVQEKYRYIKKYFDNNN